MKRLFLILAIAVSGCTTQQRYVPIPSQNVNVLDTQTGDVYVFSVKDTVWYKLPPISEAKPFEKK